jgi:hypothetical protein
VGIRVNHPFSICLFVFTLMSLPPFLPSACLPFSLFYFPLCLSLCLFPSVSLLLSICLSLSPFVTSPSRFFSYVSSFLFPPSFSCSLSFPYFTSPFLFLLSLYVSTPLSFSWLSHLLSISPLDSLHHQFHPYNEFSPFIQSVLCLFHPLCL